MTETKRYGRAALSAVAGLTMVASMVATPALATTSAPDGTVSGEGTVAQTGDAVLQSTRVTDSAVQGTFAFDQTTITPNDVIRKYFQRVPSSVCQATSDFVTDNPLGWQLSVTGDVRNAFTTPVGELAQEDSISQVMTCTCGGNPAGGRAIITADVKGIPIENLLDLAGALPGANTVTFVSSDGTETSFSIGYVIGHHAVLSYEINDEDLSASVGGNNQLWMTATPANYFVRDVVSIEVSTRDEAPAAPGTEDEHPNSPNAGVLSGSQD